MAACHSALLMGGFVRRKEVVAILILAVACIVGGLGYWGFQRYQAMSYEQEMEQRRDEAPVYSMGETFTYAEASDEGGEGSSSFEGSLQLCITDAVLYQGPAQAAGDGTWWKDSSYRETSFFADDAESGDSSNLLVFQVTIKNIDARPLSSTETGQVLFFLDSIVHLSPSNEIVYLDPDRDGDESGYFSLDAGEEREFVVGVVVQPDADSFTFSNGEGWGYRVNCTFTDKRQEGAA